MFIKQYKHSSKKNIITIEENWLERQWISTLFLNGTDTTKIDGYTLIISPSMKKNVDYKKFAVIGIGSNSLGWSSIGDRLFIVKNYFTYPEIDGMQFRVRENRCHLDTNSSPLRIYDTIYVKPY